MLNRISWLALKNIRGSLYRSLIIFMASMLVAAMALSSALTLRGAQKSLDLAVQRMGADLVVVPAGAGSAAETALLVSLPSEIWMPADLLPKVANVSGVAAVSPQLYLGRLPAELQMNSTCPGFDLFLVAFDPQTDFTIGPWLESRGDQNLTRGEAVGGSCLTLPQGMQKLNLSGQLFTMKTNLEATGTSLDQALFITLETAYDYFQSSQAVQGEPDPNDQDTFQASFQPERISSILVAVWPGANETEVAAQILREVPGVTVISNPSLFQSYRQQMALLSNTVFLVLSLVLFISAGIFGLVFSLTAHQRRREVGVLRALGIRQSSVFKVLLLEAGLLALAGGLVGVLISSLAVYLFREQIVRTIGFPLSLPGLAELSGQVAAGLILATFIVLLSALIPAYRASSQDPVIAMRE